MVRMRERDDKNRRLKKMNAEERLKAEIVQEALQTSGSPVCAARLGRLVSTSGSDGYWGDYRGGSIALCQPLQ